MTQTSQSDVIQLKLSERSARRLAALMAQADGARLVAEQVITSARDAAQAAQGRVNEATQSIAEAQGIDLPEIYELSLEARSTTLIISPRYLDPSTGRLSAIPALTPTNGVSHVSAREEPALPLELNGPDQPEQDLLAKPISPGDPPSNGST